MQGWVAQAFPVGDSPNASPPSPKSDVVAPGAKPVVPPARHSNPAVPYGSERKYNDVAEVTRLVRDILKDPKFQGNANATGKNGSPATATLTSPVSPQLNYTHPSPDKLARDNPDCTQKFDPACAWKESTTPADKDTDPNTLVRMTSDGQKIVYNNTQVFNNTIYPKAMQDAGTAPTGGGGSTDGTADRPGDASSGEQGSTDGEMHDAMSQCLESPSECTGVDPDEMWGKTQDTIRSGIESSFGDGTSIATQTLDRAMREGDCQSSESSYCVAVASLASLSDYPYNPNADFVMSEGEISIGSSVKTYSIKIKAFIMDFLAILVKLVTGWTIVMIWLGGPIGRSS